ncbi:hypothetical protein AAG747_07785 [Rapidithrix thailandica]|uniref:Uncharacterized protein n=1 Tax=Rapidithrix thailandica TaxID=413964 RepID=A0AAW9S612_9BACT
METKWLEKLSAALEMPITAFFEETQAGSRDQSQVVKGDGVVAMNHSQGNQITGPDQDKTLKDSEKLELEELRKENRELYKQLLECKDQLLKLKGL